MTNRRHRPVAGNEGDIVAQRPELEVNRRDQGVEIAARKIRPPDRPLEEHIAGKQYAARLIEKDDMAGRMAGAVKHLQRGVAHRHGVAVLQPAIRRHRPHAAKTVGARLRRQPVEQKSVLALRPFDRHAEPFSQLRRAAGMVDMPVRQQDFFRRHAQLLNGRDDARNFAARIDNRRLAGFLAPENGAVLLKRRHGNDLIFD